MLDLDRNFGHDRLMRAMTGLNCTAFEALLPRFAAAYDASLLALSLRQWAAGDGRKARLGSHESKLFYILVDCKCYPTFDLAGILFDFDRFQAHEWVHRLLPQVYRNRVTDLD
jgi:Helix-turn-helix of DDE superfamily endonuclease